MASSASTLVALMFIASLAGVAVLARQEDQVTWLIVAVCTGKGFNLDFVNSFSNKGRCSFNAVNSILFFESGSHLASDSILDLLEDLLD